ncbi:hypothetical protein Tco_0956659 [Tanacetum coccineum]
MSSSSKSTHDYSRKHQRAILEPWRKSHNRPPSPPSSSLNRHTPVSPITTNSLPSLSPPQNPSLITPLDHIHDTPSPPSSPQPQPPIMGHPLFYNYHDYHRSTYICCFHNRNIHLNHRDEMNIMFAHLKYLLTTALTTHFPPPP